MFRRPIGLAFLMTSFLSIAVSQQYYAVLITGSEPDGTSYDAVWNDTFYMRRALIESGLDSTKISVLYFDGNDYESANPRYQQEPDITTMAATILNIQGEFSQLAQTLTSNDVLFVWLFGHGNLRDEQGTDVYLEVYQ
jgi:hypothetical protein